MKKLVLALTLAAFALTGTAFAQDPNYFDNIGVYTDEAGASNCANLGINTPLNLYLVLTKLTSPEVLGWEVKITYENMQQIAFAPRGDYIDAGTRVGEHIVGLGTPLPAVDGACVLADITVFLQQYYEDPAIPSYIVLDPVYFHVMDTPVPAYLDGAGVPVEAHPSTIDGHEGGSVFFLNNGCGPVAVEESTWGSVKGLFR